MFDRFMERKFLAGRHDSLRVTEQGRRFFAKSGIEIEALEKSRRPLCRPCLDWSERRTHLSGTLGAAIFQYMLARSWAVQERKTRVVRFSPAGEQRARAWFSR